jgi:hypothetical protein
MRLIRPIQLPRSITPGSFLEPCSRQLLAITTSFDELPFKCLNLPIKQIVSLVYDADNGICGHRWIIICKPVPIKRVLIRLTIKIPSNLPNLQRFVGIFCPVDVTALSQEVLIVEQKFIKAGSSNVY